MEGQSQSTIRHCRKVNKSSLYSVPHWNYIRLHLPKGSGGFRSPKPHPKTDLLVGLYRQAIRKRVWNLDCKQACPPSSRPLFLSAARIRSRKRDRACRVCWVLAPAGVRRFAAAKRADWEGRALRRATPHLAPQCETRSFLPQQKRRYLAHKTLKRQSAERSSASVRSTPKKKTGEKSGQACLHPFSPVFFFDIDCRVINAANKHNRLVLCYFLDSRK